MSQENMIEEEGYNHLEFGRRNCDCDVLGTFEADPSAEYIALGPN